MTGKDEFLSIFGKMTIADLFQFILALIFIISFLMFCYKLTVKKHDVEAEKEKKLNESYDAAENLPEYRQQSKAIQKELKSEISNLANKIDNCIDRIEKMEVTIRKRDLNKTRDRLIRAYNYYTNPELNPSHSWTEMEADAFWRLFGDYEEDGGDGFMHTDVEPAMRSLTEIKMGEKPATKRTYII